MLDSSQVPSAVKLGPPQPCCPARGLCTARLAEARTSSLRAAPTHLTSPATHMSQRKSISEPPSGMRPPPRLPFPSPSLCGNPEPQSSFKTKPKTPISSCTNAGDLRIELRGRKVADVDVDCFGPR